LKILEKTQHVKFIANKNVYFYRHDRITRMISRLRSNLDHYPRQFWLISIIMMLAWLFHSLMWPFLMLFISQRLEQPLSNVAWLMTINAVTGMVTTFLGGAIADKYGRKGVMVFSLIFCGVGWFLFRIAGTMPIFALIMTLTGTTPLYRLAADSMIADLIPEEERLDAYSLLRMGNNLGVALGPAIGGYLASVSYNISFSIIGIGLAVIGVLIAVLAKETRPSTQSQEIYKTEKSTGYKKIFKDKVFMAILGAFTLNRICTSTLWLMLAVYARQNYGLSERLFGFIPTTNAVMVILFQLMVTRRVRRGKPEQAMALGALIYAAAIFGVAFGQGFWGFWLCMVGATVGEMILVPTTTTFTSRLAPEEMRARYMSLYTLTWGIGTGIGPLLGGVMGDSFGPRSMWFSAGVVGFAGFLLFVLINKIRRQNEPRPTVQSAGEV
jgi:MFS family permease